MPRMRPRSVIRGDGADSGVDSGVDQGAGSGVGTGRPELPAHLTRLRLACCNPRLVQDTGAPASSKLATFAETLDELLGTRPAYGRRRVTVGGRAVALTATEYEILRILSVDAGRVVTSKSLPRQAWDAGREPTDTERERAFVCQLRAKLGDAAARPAWIFTERGVGYWMPKPGEA